MSDRNAIKVETTINAVTRHNNSVNGNPRFTLHTDHGDFTTQSDAAISYEVTNITQDRRAPLPRKVTLTTTRAHRVWDITT